jgi:uncharacterized protein
MSPNEKTALITGASGGIGYALSKLFAAEGYRLVLVARSAQKLNEIAADFSKTYGVSVTVLASDLCDPKAPEAIFAALQAQAIQVNVLVNNAGFGACAPFAQADLAEVLDMVQLNVVALTHLTRLFLPGMVARGAGRILNVGSTGSFAPCPLMAAYGATKAYVLSFSEALAEELRGTGVSVTALCPGVTLTGFDQRANTTHTRLHRGALMSAEQVAAIGFQALKRGTPVVVPGLFNWLLAFSIRLSPRWLTRRISHLMMESAGN